MWFLDSESIQQIVSPIDIRKYVMSDWKSESKYWNSLYEKGLFDNNVMWHAKTHAENHYSILEKNDHNKRNMHSHNFY